MRWSIRVKFLAVMCTLLVFGLGVYLLMAVSVFKTDKTQLVFDLTRSQVSNLTGELETLFSGVSEKLKLFALLPAPLQAKMAPDLLAADSDVAAVAVYKTAGGEPEHWYHQDRFLETYGLDQTFFDRVSRAHPAPFEEILRHGEAIWNASGDDGPPLIGYGRLVVLQDNHGVPVEQWEVVGFVKLDRFIKTISLVRLSEVFVANRGGEILVQPDASALLKHPRATDAPLFREAMKLKTKTGVVKRETGGDRVLAALGKGFNDQIYVVAKASEKQVFQVVRDLSIRSLLFGSIVLTFVIMAAFLLSRSLTENIARLAERMESVSDGDLSTTLELQGRDETVLLANSFNQMIHDLKTSHDALAEMNRELDNKVKERTEQLEEQNKKIKEVQEALIHTTRLASVGEIAGRTAHEVLNPLTILLTRAGIVQKKVADDDKLGVLDDIGRAWHEDYASGGFDKLRASWENPSPLRPGKNLFQEDLENLTELTNELRDQRRALADDIRFIREEGERIGKIIDGMRRLGHLNSDVRAHSIRSVLNDCCEIMADLFAQRGFRIERVFDPGPDVARVDRDELIQAVTNLMRNSLQALEENPPPASPCMLVRLSRQGGQLWIDIEDNGAGIAAEHQSRLFESSFTTKSPDRGTGLGLGIARRFVRAYGGEIEFAGSRPHERTVFRVRLPLSGGESAQGAAA